MMGRSTYLGRVRPDLTAEDLQSPELRHKHTELVRGHLVVREPAGARHGVIAMRIGHRLAQFVESTGTRGMVVAAETGFKLFSNPDTVRAADAAFVRVESVAQSVPIGFFDRAPELAVEVLSPGDLASDVLAKVSDWLAAGSQLVWVIDGERRVARVYRPDGSESIVSDEQSLGGENVLPGFTCTVADLVQWTAGNTH